MLFFMNMLSRISFVHQSNSNSVLFSLCNIAINSEHLELVISHHNLYYKYLLKIFSFILTSNAILHATAYQFLLSCKQKHCDKFINELILHVSSYKIDRAY